MIYNKKIHLLLPKHQLIMLGFFALAIIAMVFFNIRQVSAANLAPTDVLDQNNQVMGKLPVYFFWGEGCPHCEAETIFLEKIKNSYPNIEFKKYEVFNNKENYNLFEKTLADKGEKIPGVPVTIIGEQMVVGFGNEKISGAKIKQALDIYVLKNKIHNDGDSSEPINASPEQAESVTGEHINYPIIGKINLNNLSLPILTVVLGTLDGFNPCSMWALVVLITLLLNTGSRKKMWIIGGTFILTSAISYFLFLTAWFNAFKFVGFLPAVKIGIGILAIGIGVYFLQDYIKKRKQATLTCEVTSDKTQSKIITRLQTIIQKDSMLMAIVGVTAVAFSVNLIELVCSAGIPAIYTGIMAQSHLSSVGYYSYLIGYDFFYMLDDIVVLLIAGFTWQMLQNTGKFTKYSHLIGGILLLILGVIMLFHPELLMFK